MKKTINKIEKSEDKIWGKWFKELKPKEHDNYLHKMGLSLDELKDFEKKGGIDTAIKEEAIEEKPKTKKAKKTIKPKKTKKAKKKKK